MAPVRDWPTWVKLVVAIATVLISISLAWGDMKADLRVEQTERKAMDTHLEKGVEEIKQMLREELDRHHPRQR
jgi:hypothetical protein